MIDWVVFALQKLGGKIAMVKVILTNAEKMVQKQVWPYVIWKASCLDMLTEILIELAEEQYKDLLQQML